MRVVEKLYDCGPGRRPRLGRTAGSQYLFSGLLECADCRGSITIVPGRWKLRDDSRYGCSMHAYRGDRVCTNNLLIARGVLETQLLAGLQAKILHPDVVEYTFASFEAELARSMNRQSGETATARRKLQELDAEIRNCTRAIASAGLSSFLRTRVAAEATDLETRHRDLSERLANSEPRVIKLRLRDARRFVESRLVNLQSMFSREPRLARAAIAQHVQRITLKPCGRRYIASGVWDWLGGGGGVAVRMVPGAQFAPCSHGLITPQITFCIEVAA